MSEAMGRYRALMRATSRFIGTLLAILAIMFNADASAANAGVSAAATPTRSIVVYKDLLSASVDQNTEDLERQVGFSSEFRYRHALNGFAAKLTAAQASRLRADPRVAYVVDDRPVHITGPVPIDGAAPTGVQRIEAASSTTAHEASTIAVAVIDTGIDLTHPNLNSADGINCINPDAPAQDDNGHGTHVSGTIGATNDGAGAVGVAPGTLIYAVKVLNAAGSGFFAQVICGIDWVTANADALNIRLASMSLGGLGSNDGNCGNTNLDAMHTAICASTNAGVTYVVAAGNNAKDFKTSVPAAYPEVLTVTAMSDSDGLPGGVGGRPACRLSEADDTFALFSNYAIAPTEIGHTIAGPGVCILSTWMGGGYNTISGTSMATPHVTGIAALCLGEASNPGPCTGMTPAQIVQKLRGDAAGHTVAVPGYGFLGDPSNPVVLKYYGYLVWAGPLDAPPAAPAQLRPARR